MKKISGRLSFLTLLFGKAREGVGWDRAWQELLRNQRLYWSADDHSRRFLEHGRSVLSVQICGICSHSCQTRGAFCRKAHVVCFCSLNDPMFLSCWSELCGETACFFLSIQGSGIWKRMLKEEWPLVSGNRQLLGIVIVVAKTLLRKIIQLFKFGLRSCCIWSSLWQGAILLLCREMSSQGMMSMQPAFTDPPTW